jgi:hypothetical protein
VKPKFGDVAYADLREGIKRELIDSLRASEWWTEHNQNFDQLIADYRLTWQNGQPGAGLQPRVQSYINDFVSRASRLLPSIAQKRVNATTTARLNSQPPARSAAPAGTAPGATQPRGPNGRFAEQGAPSGNGQPARRLSSAEWDAEFAKAFR